MENLFIAATDFTPEIKLDCEANIISVSGKSYPENVAEFFTPIFAWIETFFEQKNPPCIVVNFDITYFNSSSSKIFLDFFDVFENEANKGKKIIINWLYDIDDRDNYEFGEEFQEEFISLNFNLLPKRSESNSQEG